MHIDSSDQPLQQPNWPESAVHWLLFARGERFPPALAEALTSAEGHELEELLERILRSLDHLPGFQSPDDNQDDNRDDVDLVVHYDDQPTSSPNELKAAQMRLRTLLQLVAARVLRLRLEEDAPKQLEPIIEPDLLADLGQELSDVSPIGKAHCLQIMAAQADTRSLVQLCDFLKRQSVEDEQGVAIALSPLFQWPPPGLSELFNMIGEDIWRWQLLGPLLDLAGHSMRKRKLTVHPLSNQKQRVRELLSATVGRLARLAEAPQQFGNDVKTIQRVLSNAVALCVSLCDTVGLIGDEQAEGQLNQAMELPHRRVQTEAAGALARLGKDAGKQRLIALAADPAARLRAIAYADELGIESPELAPWREPTAQAEAEVIAWLADHDRFGVPPSDLELVDERTQFWPSFESPQTCYLFRFTYRFNQGDLSNLIIAGPLVYAFQADLRSLELDDVYSLFAGWQAEHDEIYEVPLSSFNSAQHSEAERLSHALRDEGLDELEPLALTFFFGERALLAIGKRDGQAVIAVTDGLENLTIPADQRPTSFTPDLVLALYRGRKLLRTFN